jgi:hypothetical protein
MGCSKCGSDNREGRKFCANCGAPMAVTCAKCGATNQSEERFCAIAEPRCLLLLQSEGKSVSVLKLSSGSLVSYAAFSRSSTVGSRSVFASRARSAATRTGIAR